MTVDELADRLNSLSISGFGDDVVKIYDADAGQMMPVTGYLYSGKDGIVELLSDDDENDDENDTV